MDDHTPYTLTEAPTQAPGKCWITGSTQGPFIQTETKIQFRDVGTLLFSVDAIREMARIAGILDEGQTDAAIVGEAHAYQRGYADGIKEDLRGQLDGIVDSIGFVADTLRDLRDSDSAPVEEPAAEPERAQSKPRRARSASGQADGATLSEGRNDVPSVAGDESAFRI